MFAHSLPQDFTVLFNGTLEHVRDSLRDADAAVEKEISKAFAGNSSSFMCVLKTQGHRLFRANALNAKMNTVEATVEEASNDLMHLSTQLTIVAALDDF